jgi:hypothetical protein
VQMDEDAKERHARLLAAEFTQGAETNP